MDILQDATRFLQKKILKNFVSAAVTVVQGENSFDLTATPAYEESSSDDGMGVIFNSRQQDFLFDIDDLVAKKEEGMREFARGDKITWKRQHTDTDADGNDTVVREDESTYEVMSDGSEPSWRPDSRYHNWIRVHTKRLLPPEYIAPPE